ncbi:hypothetical protein [Ureaplasma urealyticum]|nr:hypothetical protein [Ureaplasma urealyticum]EDX53815.1 hypothetical protein UUR9_0587 [Ureaplasma urealyticum serovar 9 str. ATCC 33175]
MKSSITCWLAYSYFLISSFNYLIKFWSLFCFVKSNDSSLIFAW